MRGVVSFRSVALVATTIAVAVACGDDHDSAHGHDTPACDAIRDACHEVDDGTPGPINDCHEIAHGDAPAACSAQQASCVALCQAAAGDAGGDAPHD